jgi:hypothetical protein
MFLVVVRRSGPEYDASRPLEELQIDTIDAWTIRLDGRRTERS